MDFDKIDRGMQRFLSIIHMPDEDFDKVYPALQEQAKAIFKESAVQKGVIDNVTNRGAIDFDAEMKALGEVLDQIKNDETLSENKKKFVLSFFEASKDATIDFYQNPRERIEVKIEKIHEAAQLPKYANPTDAGADIYAVEDTTIESGETKIIPTGLQVAIPSGYAIFIYPRSGMSVKTKMRIANSVGVIDHSYHKQIGVIFDNTSSESFTIHKGDRIAQMVIMPVPMINWVEGEVEQNERGGFGSTGS